MKYITPMFPYPSGSGLHCGHWYNYAILDSYCRWLRYQGEEVFQPFGYDAFGLPAENYAKKIGRHPKEVTEENISSFKIEIQRMNTEYQTLLSTTEESYIKETQRIFILLKEKGLAYKAKGIQEWCPSCQTVLAKEQVRNNLCDRCETQVEKKELVQWYFKITDYKQRLIDDLSKVDYPESTKKQQVHWLENLHDWCVSRQRSWGCPIPIEGETDTLDTFVDSSFYTIEYCRRTGIKPIQVDLYVGGKEHACMHLIYARFITKFLYDIGEIDFDEPFKKVIHQGMILMDGKKMSKSKGNVVNLEEYDSDHIRFYLMFLGHYFDGGNWSPQSIQGVVKFSNRIKKWLNEESGNDIIPLTSFKEKIFEHTRLFKFNKVVSEFMIFYNQNKNNKPSFEQKQEFLDLIKIYMPGFNPQQEKL